MKKENRRSIKTILAYRFFIYDFFFFLQDKSNSNIPAKESRKCNIPQTQ